MFWKVEEKSLGLRTSVIFFWWTSTKIIRGHHRSHDLAGSASHDERRYGSQGDRHSDKGRQKNCEGREKISGGRHHSSSCRKGPRPCSSFKEEGHALGDRDAGAAITQHGAAGTSPGSEKNEHGLQLPASTGPAAPCQHRPCRTTSTSCASMSLAAPPTRALYGAGCEENPFWHCLQMKGCEPGDMHKRHMLLARYLAPGSVDLHQ
ncbi:uncharacterized protein LOC144159300 isoform X2 [Haemaphysalis longicornis]